MERKWTDRTMSSPAQHCGGTRTGRISQIDLEPVRSYMARHYHESLSLGQLAELAHISPKYFGELFKKRYGHSALDYVTSLRISSAKQLLRRGERSLREIAHAVGYSDEFYFSRKFKKETGVSPSEFMRRECRSIAVCSPIIMSHLLALQLLPAAAPLDPKWTPYYYYGYHDRIRTHLRLSHPYNTHPFADNLATLAQLRPDAIIGTDQLEASDRMRLQELAPLLLVPEQADWKAQLRLIGSFLEREHLAEQWIARYEQKAAVNAARLQAAAAGERLAVLRLYRQELHLYWNRTLETVLYQDLGLCSVSRHGQPGGSVPITLAELAAINPDRILLMVCPEAISRASWLRLQHRREWQQLGAVRNGKASPLPSDPWLEYSSIALDRMLDEMLLLVTGYCPNPAPDYVYGEGTP